MNTILVLPILIPLAGAALSLIAWRSRRLHRAVAVISAGGQLVASIVLLRNVLQDGIQVTSFGNWPAPFGIVFVADIFSAVMVCVAALTGFAVMIYSLTAIDRRREAYGYYPLASLLLMGVCGAFLTGDIFNLYVWFEVMLISSFVLLALGGERPQFESAMKYVTLNLISSAIFLAAVGLLYGLTGTLNMADLARQLPLVAEQQLVVAISMLFLIAFGIKAAVFPLFFWLPASYHTPPAAVSAIFAGLLTKVGVYALIRVFTLMFVQDVGLTHRIILVIAALTMLTGVLGAISQNEFRRILSFHIISQIGYMIAGLGIFTKLALAASIFYIVHHIIVKTNLFLVSGVSYHLTGTYELKRSGGLYAKYPFLSLLFLIPAMSLAGIPPLSGFFAKLGLIEAGLAREEYALVAVAAFTGLLTLYSMTKIWGEAFWKPRPDEVDAGPVAEAHSRRMMVPITGLAAITLAIGFGAGWLFEISMTAAGQLLDTSLYIKAVLP
ncbi:MAG TPA: Na+/H+ antiporter subunit D [Thermoanaerobaculia bacterium]